MNTHTHTHRGTSILHLNATSRERGPVLVLHKSHSKGRRASLVRRVAHCDHCEHERICGGCGRRGSPRWQRGKSDKRRRSRRSKNRKQGEAGIEELSLTQSLIPHRREHFMTFQCLSAHFKADPGII